MQEMISPKRCELISDCFFKIEEWVLLCAIKAIDTAMSETDTEWFKNFKTAEENEEKPIVSDKTGKVFAGAESLDFQAAMKIFAFRKEKFSPVFQKYGLPADDESDFSAVVAQLIKTRNEISGHFDAKSVVSKYAAIDSDAALRLILRFREGILDFIAFLEFFPAICDADGQTFLGKAKAENEQTEKHLNLFQYNVEKTIEKENLSLSVFDFEQLCKRIGVSYRSDDDANSYFYTENYDKTIKSVRALSEEMAQKKAQSLPSGNVGKKHTALIVAAAVIIVLFIGLLVLLLSGKSNGGNDSGSSPQNSINTSETVQNNGSSYSVQESAPASSKETVVIPKIKGTATLGGLTVTLDQTPSTYLTFEYENDGTRAYSLGWVQSAQVIAETSDGEFYGKVSGYSVKIEKAATGNFSAVFDKEITGNIIKITVNNVYPLDDMGLPQNAGTQSLTLNIPIKYY